tara:strand:- start:760 stop:975 length:216 start_codon:yes stop_codon:yes gene_type:complete
MTVGYKPKCEGATHIGPEREEFRVGARGFLYRWLGDEWRKTTFDRVCLLTIEEFKKIQAKKRSTNEFRKYM